MEEELVQISSQAIAEFVIKGLLKKGVISDIEWRDLEIRTAHSIHLDIGMTVGSSKSKLAEFYNIGEKEMDKIIYNMKKKKRLFGEEDV